MSEIVVLVHGFFKDYRDMDYLNHYLKKQGYNLASPMFPTTMGSLVECSHKLSTYIDNLNLSPDDTLHFVGHSMGGLIIRHCLAFRNINHLGRCVLIATPNQGSFLADIALKFLRYSPINPFKSMSSLRTSAEDIPEPINSPPPKIGVIAGTNSNLILGNLLQSQNDGRVEVNSTRFRGMTDFITLPYGHHEIHHTKIAARLIDFFLKNGTFEDCLSNDSNVLPLRHER